MEATMGVGLVRNWSGMGVGTHVQAVETVCFPNQAVKESEKCTDLERQKYLHFTIEKAKCQLTFLGLTPSLRMRFSAPKAHDGKPGK